MAIAVRETAVARQERAVAAVLAGPVLAGPVLAGPMRQDGVG